MAGIAQLFLTDKELDIILGWAGESQALAAEYGGSVTDKERTLGAKLRGVRNVLECGCEGGACDVPA